MTKKKQHDQPPPDSMIDGGRHWVRVRAPRPWKPKHDGDVLVARFLSRTTRPGDGDRTYTVVTLATVDGDAVTVSGVVLSSLFDAAGDLETGTWVRIVYKGEQLSAAGRTYRDFELYVEREVGR